MLFILGALVGFFASFCSALLGGGSGLITIPAFYYIIIHNMSSGEYAMHITIATASCVSATLGFISSYKHYKAGRYDFNKILKALPYVIGGAFIGAILIRVLDTDSVKNMFAIVLFISATWMLLGGDRKHIEPPYFIRSMLLSICGFLSVVIGSTNFFTMLFIKMGMKIKQAVALTSIGIFVKSIIAIIVLNIGINIHEAQTLGYISMPLFIAAVPFSILGSLTAVKYLDIIPSRVIRMLLICLMFIAAVVMSI